MFVIQGKVTGKLNKEFQRKTSEKTYLKFWLFGEFLKDIVHLTALSGPFCVKVGDHDSISSQKLI